MKASEAQIIGDANLRNFALISSIPVALLTFRLLSCVSMKLTETGGMLNSVFSETFTLIFWSSFKLLNSFRSFSVFFFKVFKDRSEMCIESICCYFWINNQISIFIINE